MGRSKLFMLKSRPNSDNIDSFFVGNIAHFISFYIGQSQDYGFTCPFQYLKMLIISKFFLMSKLYLFYFSINLFFSLSPATTEQIN